MSMAAWLDEAQAIVPINRDDWIAFAAQLLEKLRDSHVGSTGAVEFPRRIMKDSDTKRREMRSEQLPVAPDAIVGVVTIDEKQVNGLAPMKRGFLRSRWNNLHVFLQATPPQITPKSRQSRYGRPVVPDGCTV